LRRPLIHPEAFQRDNTVLPTLSTAIKVGQSNSASAREIAHNAIVSVAGQEEFKAFISVAEDCEPAASRKSDALLGCVFSLKDNIDVAGMRTTCGSRVFANAPHAANDSWIAAALKNAGAQCIGKNNMHEFALGATGENRAYGTTVNPWDTSRGVGGSSGGSALAVALRQVHLSIGTDSGGSVRMPAGLTGVVGFKPTAKTLPMTGVAGAAWTLDSLGLFTATVADLRIVWRAVAPAHSDPAPGVLRIGYLCDDSMGRVEPVIWAHYLEAIEKLRNAGNMLTPISLPGFEDCPFIAMTIAYAEVASLHFELLRTKPSLYDQHIRGLICLGDVWSSRHYLDAQRLRSVFRQRFAEIQDRFDAVVTPSVAINAPKVGETACVRGDPPAQGLYTVMRFTVLFNCTGHPAISVPSGLDSEGLPNGIQLIGRPGKDAELQDIAQRVEQVLGVMSAAPAANSGRPRSD
jgi:aspartyl-tRNA(Asn)/glutamyl-tRNA(Gln) amidotransferase subunit A